MRLHVVLVGDSWLVSDRHVAPDSGSAGSWRQDLIELLFLPLLRVLRTARLDRCGIGSVVACLGMRGLRDRRSANFRDHGHGSEARPMMGTISGQITVQNDKAATKCEAMLYFVD